MSTFPFNDVNNFDLNVLLQLQHDIGVGTGGAGGAPAPPPPGPKCGGGGRAYPSTPPPLYSWLKTPYFVNL